MKWLILALFVAGIVFLSIGFWQDKASNFEDGTFLYKIASIIVGIVCLAASIIVIVVTAFGRA